MSNIGLFGHEIFHNKESSEWREKIPKEEAVKKVWVEDMKICIKENGSKTGISKLLKTKIK